MIEESITVTVTRTVVESIEDARDLQDWVANQPGLHCTIVARTDGNWYMEVGGETVDSCPIEFGDTVTWDGNRFTISKPDNTV